MIRWPPGQIPLPQKIFVVEPQLLKLARATLVSLSSDFFEVPEAWLPSAMFCTPLRAACTIWSRVRLRWSTYRSQKRTVTS